MRDWDGHLRSLLSGQLNPDIEYTIEEVVGAEPVSIEDIKYACAIVSGANRGLTRGKSGEL